MGMPVRFCLPWLMQFHPRYAERRQELLAEGVNPANLSVFGAAFTQYLTSSKRVTNAAVAVRPPSHRSNADTLADLPHAELQGTVLAHATEAEEQQALYPHPRGIAVVDRRRYLSRKFEAGNLGARRQCPRQRNFAPWPLGRSFSYQLENDRDLTPRPPTRVDCAGYG